MRNPAQTPYPPNPTQTSAYRASCRMVGRLLSASLMVSLVVPLSGCEQSPSEATTESQSQIADNNNEDTDSATELTSDTLPTVDTIDSTTEPSTRNQPLQIDWSKVDSKAKPVDPASFAYPMAIDSTPVTAYAEYFGVTASEARHSLTIGTASNEPLDALLTQLGNSYLSHQLTDGKDIKLIIHTTPNVSASQHDYVIANEFARGLVLPIVIEPKT